MNAWEEQLKRERQMLKKAMHRVALAEKWKDDGENVDERFLSLAFQWNAITKEEEAKAKKSKRVVKRYPPIRVRRPIRDAVAVAVAVRGPLPPFKNVIVAQEKESETQSGDRFQSLP